MAQMVEVTKDFEKMTAEAFTALEDDSRSWDGMYCIYDVLADLYMMPMVFRTRQLAIRSFQKFVMDQSKQGMTGPDDYQLFWTGRFCSDTGQTQSLLSPIRVEVVEKPVKDLTDVM